jgi:hypothetical protein
MGASYIRGFIFVKRLEKKGKMMRMILDCAVCSSQNFVSDKRRAVREIPPCCWKCGEILPLPGETDPVPMESKKRTEKENAPGSEGNE